MRGGLRRSGRAARLGLVFAALYGSAGVSTPFLPIFLKARGLSPDAVGLVLSLPLLARMAAGPLLASAADRFHLRRTPIALFAVGAAAASALLSLARGVPALAGAWLLASTLVGACGPLTDVLILKETAEGPIPYALPRSLGSAAYVLANLLAGALISGSGRLPALGPAVVPAALVACAALGAAFAALTLPPRPVLEAHPPATRRAAAVRLLRDPPFRRMLVGVGLIQASHAFYYGFGSLVWRREGLPASTIGGLWAVGVVAEIAFLVFGERLRRRLGPDRLLLLGGAGAAVRWTLLALGAPAWSLPLVQVLHALSFTATFVASLRLVERLSPPEDASAAQTLNAAVSFGLMTGAATLVCGPLDAAIGRGGYGVMAALAVAGVLIARGAAPGSLSPRGTPPADEGASLRT